MSFCNLMIGRKDRRDFRSRKCSRSVAIEAPLTVQTATGVEEEFRRTTHDEINSGRVALQGIVHDAQYLLIVLISLPFVY